MAEQEGCCGRDLGMYVFRRLTLEEDVYQLQKRGYALGRRLEQDVEDAISSATQDDGCVLNTTEANFQTWAIFAALKGTPDVLDKLAAVKKMCETRQANGVTLDRCITASINHMLKENWV